MYIQQYHPYVEQINLIIQSHFITVVIVIRLGKLAKWWYNSAHALCIMTYILFMFPNFYINYYASMFFNI